MPPEPRCGGNLGGHLRRLGVLPAPGALRGRRAVLRLPHRAADGPGGDAGLPRAGNGRRVRRRPQPVGRRRGVARGGAVRHRAVRRVLAAELPARPAARRRRRAHPVDPAPLGGLPASRVGGGARPGRRARPPDQAHLPRLRRRARPLRGLRGVARRRAAAAPRPAGPRRRHRGGDGRAVVRAAHRRHAVPGRRPVVQAGRRRRPGRALLVDLALVLSARLPAAVRPPRRRRVRVGALGAQNGPARARLPVARHAARARRVLDDPEPEPALHAPAPARGRPRRDGGHSLAARAVAARRRGGPRRAGRAPGVDDDLRDPAPSHGRRVPHAPRAAEPARARRLAAAADPRRADARERRQAGHGGRGAELQLPRGVEPALRGAGAGPAARDDPGVGGAAARSRPDGAQDRVAGAQLLRCEARGHHRARSRARTPTSPRRSR